MDTTGIMDFEPLTLPDSDDGSSEYRNYKLAMGKIAKCETLADVIDNVNWLDYIAVYDPEWVCRFLDDRFEGIEEFQNHGMGVVLDYCRNIKNRYLMTAKRPLEFEETISKDSLAFQMKFMNYIKGFRPDLGLMDKFPRHFHQKGRELVLAVEAIINKKRNGSIPNE